MTKKNRNYKELGDAVILYPNNYINDIEGEKLEDMCEVFLKKGVGRIVIDFSGTDIINSIGVSILIGIIEKVKEKNGVLMFSGLKRVNYDIFRLVGLTNHIQVFETEEDAVAGVRAAGARLLM